MMHITIEVIKLPIDKRVASLIFDSIFLIIMGLILNYLIPLVVILVAILPRVEPVLPAVAAADEIPEVLIIQVDIEGTVVIAIAPTKKLTMTNPKDKMPLLANHPNFSIESASPEVSNKSLYRSISSVSAHS